MISARSWWLVVTILGGGASVLLAAVFRYVPSTEDLLDPLGRPATLTDSIVSSSAGLDRVTTVLVPKQAELTRRISVLTTVAGSLDEVVDHAGELTPLAGDANRGIATLSTSPAPCRRSSPESPATRTTRQMPLATWAARSPPSTRACQRSVTGWYRCTPAWDHWDRAQTRSPRYSHKSSANHNASRPCHRYWACCPGPPTADMHNDDATTTVRVRPCG